MPRYKRHFPASVQSVVARRQPPVIVRRFALALGLLILMTTGLAGCQYGARGRLRPDPFEELPPEERVAKYQELLTADPDDAVTHFRLGNAYYDLHQLTRAEEEYRRTTELDPGMAAAHANLGAVLEDEGDQKKALESYLRAIELAPDDARAYTNLGSLYYAMAQGQNVQNQEELYDKAADAYREALAIDPDNVEAHYNLGVAYADARVYREALRHWQKVLELDPGGPVGNKALSNINLLRTMRLREISQDREE